MFHWTTRRGMFEASDTPCSALCCNCLQLSCCHPPEITVQTVQASCFTAVAAETTTEDGPAKNNNNNPPPIHLIVKNSYSHDDDDTDEEQGQAERRGQRRRSRQFSNWMRDLYHIDDSIRIRDLILVGSHDAASYTIPAFRLFSAVARTQSYSILHQLQSGIRFLDLRIASSEEGNDIAIWHGCVVGAKFHIVLDEIRTFITQHPEELIILYIVPEFGKFFTSAQRIYALDLIQQTLLAPSASNTNNQQEEEDEQLSLVNNHLFHGDHLLDMLQDWTLRDLYRNMGRTQRVVVLIHDRFFQQLHDAIPCKNIHTEFSQQQQQHGRGSRSRGGGGLLTVSDIQARYGYCRAETYMRNLWHNTRNLQELLASALMDVQQHGGGTPAIFGTITTSCQFHVSQLLATPGVGSVWDAIQALIGRNSLRPITWAYRLYHKDRQDQRFFTQEKEEAEEDSIGILDNFLRTNINEPWNVFLLDYIDQCPWTIQFLTALNFPVTLSIQMATYRMDSHQPRTIDITELVQSFVCRHRVLYLTNLIRDLNLSNTLGGTITIAYQSSSSSSSSSTTTTPFSSPPTNTTSISQSTSWSSSSSLEEMNPQVPHLSGSTSGYFASKDSEDTNVTSPSDNDNDNNNAKNKEKNSNNTVIHSHFVLTFRIKDSMLEAEYSSPYFYFMLLLSHFGCFCTPEMKDTIQIVTIPQSANSGHIYHGRLVLGNSNDNVNANRRDDNEDFDNVWMPTSNDSTVLKFHKVNNNNTATTRTTRSTTCHDNLPNLEFQVIQ